MLEILLVDDSQEKTNSIKAYLSNQITNCSEIIVKTNIRDARAALMEKSYDLLILDIQLPEFENTVVRADAGISLLSELTYETRNNINRNRRILNRPSIILVLTEHEDSIMQYKDQFDDSIFRIAKYDGFTDSWQSLLQQCIDHIYAINETASTKMVSYDYHVGILCALKKELDFILELGFDWKLFRSPSDSTTIYFITSLEINQKRIKIVCSTPDQMGITDSTIATLKMIDNFKPKCIFMTGIMGGIESKVNIGDIIFANPCYSHESGKYIQSELGAPEFLPTTTHVLPSTNLLSLAQELSFNSKLMKEIHADYEGSKPDHSPTIHIGPVSSGNAVIANESILKGIKKNERRLLGIDMEIYGLYRSCLLSKNPKPDFIAFKSVSDFADNTKSDEYQEYCSYTSTRIIDYILRNMLIQNHVI
ncbi:phosphorylase family protein [Domibacillus indicus]|uniref:phosphorylase family protein n=1 Tax=Domibacillus indicus TaxID=1437523 RepID=UPI000617CE7E|nr:response regulator [Domibacillus indicus]